MLDITKSEADTREKLQPNSHDDWALGQGDQENLTSTTWDQ